MMILTIAFYGFIVIISIQLLYYLFIFSRFSFYKHNTQTTSKLKDISIIICAKNEAESLKEHLPFYTTQEYPNFELILVNDRSTDSTYQVMEKFSDKHNHVTVVNVQDNETFWGNKKYALTLGIKTAKYNHLIFTDADCKPLSKHWIKQMSSQFNSSKNIILGYGAYKKIKYSFLNKCIRFETLLTAIQYFSYALKGIPYMGVGRNLAYTKDIFYKSNGFADHINILSGDDDLFINQNATKKNIAICTIPLSFTKSLPETSFSSWFLQKRRHISTSHNYKLKHKILLALFYVSQLLFWVLAITLLSFQFKPIYTILMVSCVILVKYIIVGVSAKKLLEKDLIFLIPILELFLVCFQLSIFITNIFSKPKHWK